MPLPASYRSVYDSSPISYNTNVVSPAVLALMSQPRPTTALPASFSGNRAMAGIPQAPGAALTLGTASGTDMLSQVLKTIQNMTGPTSTQNTTSNVVQGRSPELEKGIQDMITQLNSLSTGYQSAFNAKQATFDDVIRSLTNAYQGRASGEAGAIGTAALSSGLAPFEATQLGTNALEEVMRQYYPQLAGLRSEQAQVPIALQDALRGVGQDYSSVLANIISPYQRAVAGTTTTGTAEGTDTLGRLTSMGTIAQALAKLQQDKELQDKNDALTWAIKQGDWANALQLMMGQEAGATARTQMGETGATGRTGMTVQGQLQQQSQKDIAAALRTLMGEVGATGRTVLGEGGATDRTAMAQIGETTRQASAQNQALRVLRMTDSEDYQGGGLSDAELEAAIGGI